MKKVAILQSNYIPWKGYFDLINTVDEFIIYDEMQYTRRDWRNRNKIKTANGLHWLTIPVEVKNKFLQRINETKVTDSKWAKTHWQTIRQSYLTTRYFNDYKDEIEYTYQLASSKKLLTEINLIFIKLFCSILDIKTKISSSSDFVLEDGKSQRLVNLVNCVEGKEYISGPAAKAYLDEGVFKKKGISVSWIDYSDYPVYSQSYPPFEHGVSILDLLFNTGPSMREYMKSF